MKHIWMNITYNGTNFSGMAKQLNRRTVQGEIEETLSELINKNIRIEFSGRTDAKVHAINQFIMLKIKDDFSITLERIKIMFNKKYDDVQIKDLWYEEDKKKHPRFSAKGKVYQYIIDNNEIKNPIEINTLLQVAKPLDVKIMKKIAKMLIGQKDFASFTAKTTYESYVRTIDNIKIKKNRKNIITIEVIGPGFMRYMVRNIVGMLIECGLKNKNAKDVEELLNHPEKGKCHHKAKARGLYLKEVKY